jgi:hypothetical protein
MQHLGYQGRLNGPVDNPASSCSSCHSVAQIPADLSEESTPPSPAVNASPAVIAGYFRNIPAGTPFTAGQYSLDYSMQLQNGIANWAHQTNLAFPAPPSVDGRQRRVLSASRDVRVSAAPRE